MKTTTTAVFPAMEENNYCVSHPVNFVAEMLLMLVSRPTIVFAFDVLQS